MSFEVKDFFHQATCTYSYVAWDSTSREAVVMDPVLDYDPAAGATGTVFAEQQAAHIRRNGLTLKWILETHAHADHLSAAPFFRQRFPGSRLAIGRGIVEVQSRFKQLFNLEADFATDGSQFDLLLAEGNVLPLGALEIRVLATPGHTSDSLTYVIGKAAFVGDSIFMPDMGSARCDFPGGDAAALYRSIHKLFALPDETVLYMCHDYAPGGRDYRNTTTVGEQKANNIHVSGRSEADFVRLRTERDATLGAPQLLFPAVQANIRAGELPPAEGNGIAYMKIPLNRFAH